MSNDAHKPVLIDEVEAVFAEKSLQIYVDGTLGAGGHAERILSTHPEIEIFIGIDQDSTALKIAREKLKPWEPKLKLVKGNFREIRSLLEEMQIRKVDGLLVDIGVSSMQLDSKERGFSFREDAPLDMRMDQEHNPVTAFEIINTWSEGDLGVLFRDYGEEMMWRRAARVIVEQRKREEIKTTFDLKRVLDPIWPKWKTPSRTDPVTKIFQALRIAVNEELEALDLLLNQGIELLDKGGRMAVISFHSLEDRKVKHFFRHLASDKWDTSGRGGVFLDKDPVVILPGKQPIIAKDAEIEKNPRSRSAKMRFCEKL